MYKPYSSEKKGYSVSHPKLYRVAGAAIHRCERLTSKYWDRYGGRGILWLFESPTAFCEWALASGYQEGLTLDRIDNDGSYSPENCRWITYAENLKNRRPFAEWDTTKKAIAELVSTNLITSKSPALNRYLGVKQCIA